MPSSSPTTNPSAEERPAKRARTDEGDQSEQLFHPGLLEAGSAQVLAKEYTDSQPYHHSVIEKLFQQDLLQKVRREIKENLVFTEKETDIYKVRQTGDLANLDGLEGQERSKLQSLLLLRNALYSKRFRIFIQKITGAGGLSGSKIDMSINNYTRGCHLLNHDDVIGTRSVSYILYLPDPSEPWLKEYGGALELYPVTSEGIPMDEPSCTIPPSWNQFIMFAVQPGHSFHSVEEVVTEGKERLSISGWFHVAQEGEEGYSSETKDEERSKSTLSQLLVEQEDTGTEYDTALKEEEALSEQDKIELREFMNEQYLDLRALSQINEKFCEDSHIQLAEMLSPELAKSLEAILSKTDARDGIDAKKMTAHGTAVGRGWTVAGPPHAHRFLTLLPSTSPLSAPIDANTDTDTDEAAQILAKIQHGIQGPAFRKWLSLLSSLVPIKRATKVRRFRPGLDYTLAVKNKTPLLEINLCLTPASPIWEHGEVGGYSCFMAPHEDEDAAIYKAARDEDDGILLTTQAAWNEMTIVMRDPGVLTFTKYVSVKAGASRWDICGAFWVDVTPDDEGEVAS